MDWLCLGHATWLVEAAGLRLLFDPLLGPTHHGGLLEVWPRRRLEAGALRPDFVLISHAHPDHFDVPSLHRLLSLDPEAVVVTPDALVAWAAGQLGARSVRLVAPGHRIDLDGVSLVTTPSVAPDEWGAMLATADGVAWNQVDTVFDDDDHVRRVVRASLDALGARSLDLMLARWQPLLEVAVQLGERTSFPYSDHGVVAAGSRVVIPSAAGDAFAAPHGAMNRQVFPVDEERFRRDLGTASPSTVIMPARLGARYRLRAGEVTCEPGGATDLATILDDGAAVDPRVYAPLEPGPVTDRGLVDVDAATVRADIEAWIHATLAPAIGRAHGHESLRLVLDLRFVDAAEPITIVVRAGEVTVRRGFDAGWDALTIVSASMLWEVLHARRHWGDVLLAGALRACTRAYRIENGALRPIGLPAIFVYLGLSYDESVRQVVRRQVAEARAGDTTR